MDQSIEIEPHKSKCLGCELIVGSTIKGIITPSWEGNSIATLSIEGPSGETLVSNIIEDEHSFEFTPQYTGLHKVCLASSVDSSASISIYVAIWQYSYNILFFCAGLGLFILGLILVLTSKE